MFFGVRSSYWKSVAGLALDFWNFESDLDLVWDFGFGNMVLAICVLKFCSVLAYHSLGPAISSKWKSRPWGTHLVGQNMTLTRKNMRNVLFSIYHKFKKIREIKISHFEKSILRFLFLGFWQNPRQHFNFGLKFQKYYFQKTHKIWTLNSKY